MSVFFKTVAGVFTALILWLFLNKHNKEHSVLLTLAVCAMVLTAAITFLRPIIQFTQKLQTIGNLDGDLLGVILKSVGIGLIAEFTALVCKDAGNEAMGKALQLVSSAVVLWLSIPVFEKLLSLLDEILGTV